MLLISCFAIMILSSFVNGRSALKKRIFPWLPRVLTNTNSRFPLVVMEIILPFRRGNIHNLKIWSDHLNIVPNFSVKTPLIYD